MIEKSEHAKLNEAKWDSRAETFDNRRFSYFRFMQRKLVLMLSLTPGSRLLDLGCGTGWALGYANELVKGQGELYGIDISSKMIEQAKLNYSHCKNIRFHQTSADNLPFDGEFFDCVISSNSFHHYFSPRKALDEVHRVLKPGGKVYILDITSDSLLGRTLDRWARMREKEHVKFYSSLEYQKLFSDSRFKYAGGKSIRGLLVIKIQIAERPQ